VAKHVRVCPGDLYAGSSGEPSQTPGGRMAVHPGAAAVEQDRPAKAGACRPVDGAPDGWRQGHQDDLGALAAHAQDPVAVLFADAARPGSAVSVQDLARFAETFADLADPDVMSQAWR
jgi:hypothetical protein